MKKSTVFLIIATISVLTYAFITVLPHNSTAKLFSVKQAINLAGSNRNELESFLRYCAAKNDDEMIEAAKYIIKYMPYHQSYPKSIYQFYDAIDSVITAHSNDRSVQEYKIDSLNRHYSHLFRPEPDIYNISAEFLIKNIEEAFGQWRNGKWAKHLSFDEFCEYILPYKCFEGQPLTDWRGEYRDHCRGNLEMLDVYNDYAGNPQAAATEVNLAMKKVTGQRLGQLDTYPIFRHTTLMNMPCAHCPAYCMNSALLMRSKGIPVSYDYIPQWGNRALGHSWNTVWTLRYKSLEFSPHETDPGTIHYPYLKVPKIFRNTYKPSAEFMNLKQKGYIPNSLNNPFIKDVTSEYMTVSDIKVKLTRRLKRNEIPFIAVFDNERWVPVFWGKTKGKTAYFKNMGRQVMYIVVTFSNNASDYPEFLTPPFYLDEKGETKQVTLDSSAVRKIAMSRKFPVGDNIYWINELLKGGVIEGSKTPEFIDCKPIVNFPSQKVCTGTVESLTDKTFRYYRFRASQDERCDMAEIYFYDGDKLLTPEVSSRGSAALFDDRKAMSDPAAIQDRDGITYFSAEGDRVIVFDFGKPVHISKIAFARRGDDNSVLPGQTYTLYFWDNENWIPVAEQKADDFIIEFQDVPQNALMLMKCQKGSEHRIFLYDDKGMVEWF